MSDLASPWTTIAIGVISAAVGTLAVSPAKKRFELWRLSKGIRLTNFAPSGSGHYRIWVENHGTETITDAVAYLDLNNSPKDIVESSIPVYEGIGYNEGIKRGRLCWAVKDNPHNIDICPGERQLLNFVQIRHINRPQGGTQPIVVVASEGGFGDSPGSLARTTLELKHYVGTIRIVGKNILPRDFDVEVAVKGNLFSNAHEPAAKKFVRGLPFVFGRNPNSF